MRKSRASTEAVAAREVTKPDEQWRQELTPLQYSVLRHAHTERPFTGEHELMQYRSPVWVGPSLNTWPRWPPQLRQTTSVRRMNRLLSGLNSTASATAG